jgi:hypothetical protein
MSTVEILVIPPFFAADLMLASPLMKIIPKKPVAFAVPTLGPNGLLVALIGVVKAQLDIIEAIASDAKTILTFLFILVWFDCPTRKAFRTRPVFGGFWAPLVNI